MSQSIDHHQLIKTLGRAGLIPFVLLALIVVYPIGRLIWNSFFDLRLSGGGTAQFVGIEEAHRTCLRSLQQ